MNSKMNKYFKSIISLCLSGFIMTSMQTGSLQYVQAAELRKEQTEQLLENAKQDMEEGTYEQGEAIITLESSDLVALVQEGQYRYDKNVKVADVCEFGENEDGLKNRYIVRLTSNKYSTEELMKIALKQYYVDGISPNGHFQLMDNSTYNDAYKAKQWYLESESFQNNAINSGINFSKQNVTLQETPVIAVLDTGINYKHSDLKENMWVNPYPQKLKGTYGYDFGEDDSDPMDTYGHGTHVAGIAAARQNNGIGITGVSNAKIMALKITDERMFISEWSIINAYEYVKDALNAGVNIKAVNCSWGGSSDTNGLLSKAITAVGELGALSIFASGNDGINWDSVSENRRTTPYDLDSPYIVIVGAVNEKDQKAYYSDYSSKMVDVFAPGSNMLSTYIGDLYIPQIYDESTRNNLTTYYNKCSNSDENILPPGQNYKSIYTASELGIKTDYDVDVKWINEGEEGYICLEVIRNWPTSFYDYEKEEAGSIYVDVTDLKLNPQSTYYVEFMYGEGKENDMCWESSYKLSNSESSRFVNIDGKTYMRIIGLQIAIDGIGKKNVFYINDFAVSVANPDSSCFGQYAYLSGTSMAAPVVSGVLATFAGANPDMDAVTLRKELLGCIRKVSGLEDKCKTGGIIDCSKLYTRVNEVTLNKTSATLKYGKSLTLKAKITPKTATNTKVTWKSSNTKYATVNSKGGVKVKKAGIGHSVKITATAADGSKKKAVCKIKIKK